MDEFIKKAKILINQINRRVMKGEKIPHDEKIFSIFQPHTEWICKGKAGVPVELGKRVVILEDEFGLILNHQVMDKITDEKVAVPFVLETKEKFSELYSCSFDKGFHSPENQINLRKILPVIALPKKGRLSKKDIEYQHSEEYIKAKNKHSAVESAINALEIHGLDKCPDHGIYGFERYVSLAILGRNVQQLGSILTKRKLYYLKLKKAS